MKVVLGLGNPGQKYEWTRHNVGFLVVDRIASGNRIAVNRNKHRSLIGDWQVGEERVLLVKPQTYMNRSGEAVKLLFRYFPVAAQDLVVIHDDLDLPFGRIRIRQRGGAGGHLGVLSILDALGEEEFLRVRVGVGRPPQGMDPTDYVLKPFDTAEEELLEGVVSRAAQAVETLLQEGPHRAMERFNRAE